MKFRTLLFGSVMLFVIIWSSSLVQAQSSNKTNVTAGEVLLSEDFNNYKDGKQPPGWWVEGGEAIYVDDGRLMIEADPKTKWFDNLKVTRLPGI